MLKPIVRTTHAIWRQPGWQLLIIVLLLGAALLWSYFGIASPASNNAEERLIVIGAGAAAAIAIWGVVGQWSISSRQQTIQFLREIETDKDFIDAQKIFNEMAHNGQLVKYAYPFKRTNRWKKLGADAQQAAIDSYNTTAEAIYLVLNTDEMVAIGVKCSILDYRLVCTYRRQTMIRRWAAAKHFVDALRTTNGPHTLWIELERLSKRLEDDPYHMIL